MKFLVTYRNFVPIREGLERCGYTVYENLWNPTDDQLLDCEGYLVDMYHAMKRPWDTLRLKSRLRRRGIPLIGWNRDAPWNNGARRRRLWWFKKLAVLDIYMAHSLQGAAAFSVHPYYLPNAAWATHYHLSGVTLSELRDSQRYRYDVSFVGNLNAQKYPEFTDRARFFEELGARLKTFGISTCFQHGKDIDIAGQVDLIQRSRINLNYSAACDDGPEKSWGLPERCYGVPAVGGFLLSDTRNHSKDDFVPGDEWVDYENLNDCVQKIRHYLAHFDTARDVAERAYRRVIRDHTYEHRARAMVSAVREWKTARQRIGVAAK